MEKARRQMGHNAQYYLEMAQAYYNSNYSDPILRHTRNGLRNGIIDIHHKNDNPDVLYSIWYRPEHTSIRTESISTGKSLSEEDLQISDLAGDDFEIANSILIYKSGYIKIETTAYENEELYAKKMLTNLYSHIEEIEHSMNRNRSPHLCGATMFDEIGTTDGFSYYATNGIEVHLKTIHRFCKENTNRKHFEMKAIPFYKEMNENTTIHVSFIDFASKNPTVSQCNFATMELMEYVNGMNLELMKESNSYPFMLTEGATIATWQNVNHKPLFL